MKNIYHNIRLWILIIIASGAVLASGCKKFIEVDPPVTSVNEGNVWNDDATANGAIIGIYANMSNTLFSFNLTVYPELLADNLELFVEREGYAAYFQNSLLANDPVSVPKFWNTIYPNIFTVNSAIEGISASSTLSDKIKQNLLGEAHFLRAFYYFYLVNLYGEVPLALTTDYTQNNKLVKSPISKVYEQIKSDLQIAQGLLPDNYLQSDGISTFSGSEGERIRPNKSTAIGLLARVHLYLQEWQNAEQAASEVINDVERYSPSPLNEVFLKNSKETLWALQPVRANINTEEGDVFNLREGGPDDSRHVIYLSDRLYNIFQLGDQRKAAWTATQTDGTTIYPYSQKYKAVAGSSDVSEYSICLRLGEQYLIRAEARIQQNKVAEGIADLNTLRDRAIDKNETDESKRLKLLATSLSKDAALTALDYERRVELFCEWGHRWFDLKRTGQVNTVMTTVTPLKGGGSWNPYKSLLPIPADDIRINPAIIQNTGYTQ